MEVNEFRVPMDIISAGPDEVDTPENRALEEAGPKVCPLCNSRVRIFYVHYTSKILMCENMHCEYPFGDDVKVYESDDDTYFQSEQDLCTFKSKKSNHSGRNSNHLSGTQSQGTGSEVSSSEWSDIARLNMVYDSDDSLVSNIFSRRSNRRQMERAKKQENEEKIKKNVEKIKEFNKVLFDNVDDFDTIRNEKWIENLSSMQSSSGMRLVKEQELQKLKKNQNIGIKELKIDIESRQDSMSSIKIEIGSKDKTQENNVQNIEVTNKC